jgi:hypothetical protein
VKIGKSVTETFEMLKIAFGEEAMCRTQTYEWWKRFKEGLTLVDDDPHSGRPSTSKTDDNVAKVCEVIHSNRCLTVREVAEELSISKTVCHEILTENLGMHRIAAKFVPRLLTDDQKQNRADMSSWPNTRRLSFHSLCTLQILHQLTSFCFQSSNQRRKSAVLSLLRRSRQIR